ncbi:tetratricopeptide repeat-containing glycosyltransferase family 2 protein [Bacillus toyonensis]|uniref:tetratricopeptide repeat-containing glycosyltransferase family 2 protein n=1 Tax=Bacillus toyonensis TaxID=155322 RepID=UPI00119D2229|nr:glycosyltransferase [Bacillus toyonensis]
MVTISLCMIVKNEDKTLDRCLQSVKGIPDEIIIVDTGSTDRTKEVAQKWTPHVYDFEWSYDFSAARNEAFRHATKDYIFWLDADDILKTEDAQKLQVLKNGLDSRIDAVSMKYHADFDAQGNVISSAVRFRLFKTTKRYTWVGIVHEHIEVSTTDLTIASDIIVAHQTHNRKCSSRNLDLYEKYLAGGNTLTPHDLFHYGRELLLHKRYKDAISIFEQYLASPYVDDEIRIFTLNELTSCYNLIQNTSKEQETILQSFLYSTPQPVFCCRMGEYFKNKQDLQTAIFWYQLALQVPVEYSWAQDKIVFRTWFPHKELGLCHEQQKQFTRAIHHYEQVLTYLPDEETQQALQRLLAKQAEK